MNLREIQFPDLAKLKEIHEKFYADSFDFPDFTRFLCSFVVNDNDGAVSAGGIRLIPEAIFITNKDKPIKARRAALLGILSASSFVADKNGYDQIHAFIQNDENWIKHLRKIGFRDCNGRALYLNL